jgi:hypothetical protein
MSNIPKMVKYFGDKVGGSHFELKKSLKVVDNSHSKRRRKRREKGERGYKSGKCKRGKWVL